MHKANLTLLVFNFSIKGVYQVLKYGMFLIAVATLSNSEQLESNYPFTYYNSTNFLSLTKFNNTSTYSGSTSADTSSSSRIVSTLYL